MADMAKLRDLSKGELIHMLTSINTLAVEAGDRWKGLIGTHDMNCHTRHAGCLAAAVLDTMDRPK